ncbi:MULTISPECIES: dihydroxyacetone kinase subunit DhaL [Paenibacillus]|uniref:phosphoenolpyruvate--glycerone phosphotransferase n=1 Tax=Paenibacillus naphthalenovorans TaxID=162209 RepID=A0A0U2WDD6_9BACL|nr:MULTISPECIES: dihydroxyacetone kinase subunit DhaL [Paenibacillus]ALS23354.1 PTS-dependent dihydroxyacetone kinase, ADP-binding subunit DhaL [Paenibacillus naphthalenovorans]NTZ17074.1 dihydroxyacetone kinase subunit L [Paenibacillus sp. JMULE4]GCL72834.1 dihydroxyacetone kinase subunit L [Paenibacillus naphthalenovorans]SDI07864.1 dihydroxyacetone kinase, C-terminal domain [Paenibacillus naphthalenovorans]
MKETLNVQDIKNILQEISRIMDENKDYLCKLDGALGDGDIGLTMSKGFRAVVENLPNTSNENIGVVLMNSAVVMGETVASTMGTLMASAIIRGGKVTQGKSELTAEDLLTMTRAMVHALVERGKAKAGEKTVLDSIIPAMEALEAAAKEGKSLKETINEAYAAADKGARHTIEMQARHGRAGRYLERSIGLQDPGATVGALFFKGFSNYVNAGTFTSA